MESAENTKRPAEQWSGCSGSNKMMNIYFAAARSHISTRTHQ